MRVGESIFIDAEPAESWQIVTDPGKQVGLLAGVTRWDRENDVDGLGARFTMRMHVGSAEVGSTIEVVECDPQRDYAWTSVLGISQRGRWRLRAEDAGTRVELRLSYQAPGGILGTISDYAAAPSVQGNLKESLRRLKQMMEGEGSMAEESPGLVERATTTLGQGIHTVKTLADAGFIKAE